MQDEIDEEYIFTMVIYSILFLGRFLEALIIEIHVYKFFFLESQNDRICSFNEHLIAGVRENKCILVGFAVLTTYLVIHSLAVPVFGIFLEIQAGKSIDCDAYTYYGYYSIYWILDIFRYIYDIGVRLFMVMAMIVASRIWTKPWADSGNEWSVFHSDHHTIIELEIMEDSEKSDRDDNSTKPCEFKEPETYSDYMQDKKKINQSHHEMAEDYLQRGYKVGKIYDIFRTWFILPWILFIISSYLDSDDILRFWMDGSDDAVRYTTSNISYLVFNVSQVILLTVPFLCSKRMNAYHSTYLSQLQEEQLTKHTTASRMALASMQKITKNNSYDFTPYIWGTGINIHLDDPLTNIFLFISIFYAVVGILF